MLPLLVNAAPRATSATVAGLGVVDAVPVGVAEAVPVVAPLARGSGVDSADAEGRRLALDDGDVVRDCAWERAPSAEPVPLRVSVLLPLGVRCPLRDELPLDVTAALCDGLALGVEVGVPVGDGDGARPLASWLGLDVGVPVPACDALRDCVCDRLCDLLRVRLAV